MQGHGALTPGSGIRIILVRVTPREITPRGSRVLVGAMKIVKGDTVYLRSGKDVANRGGRLQEALDIRDDERFQAKRAELAMAAQLEAANKVKGVRGKVIRVLPREGKVVVEGLNMVTRHQKPKATGGAAQVQQGGRIKMEAPIPVSRVMLVCPHCDKPTRIGIRIDEEERTTPTGSKTVTVRHRVCKQCHEVMLRPTDSLGK